MNRAAIPGTRPPAPRLFPPETRSASEGSTLRRPGTPSPEAARSPPRAGSPRRAPKSRQSRSSPPAAAPEASPIQPRSCVGPPFRKFRSRGGEAPRRHSKSPSGPLSRILSPGFPGSRSFLWARGRPRAQAADPETDRLRRNGTGAHCLPIWPCSAWGLPCPRRCRRGGALLPHRFTLAVRPRKSERRSVLCGTFLRVAATGRYPACRPFGVRTFLPDFSGRSRGPLGPGPWYHLRSLLLSSPKYFVHSSTSTACFSSREPDSDLVPKCFQKSSGRNALAPASRTRRDSP